MPARLGLLTVDLCITDALTLKDKRQVVRSLLDRAWRRQRVSGAEVGCLDNVRRAELAFACVANEGGHVREVLQSVLRSVASEPRAVVQDSDIELL